ncbi:MAG: hypothetical protein MUF50_03155 [Planctomycetes bacterium]|jgi:hypothetical protein|nr:hypothetical protein [Planctomycetota bacterium]
METFSLESINIVNDLTKTLSRAGFTLDDVKKMTEYISTNNGAADIRKILNKKVVLKDLGMKYGHEHFINTNREDYLKHFLATFGSNYYAYCSEKNGIVRLDFDKISLLSVKNEDCMKVIDSLSKKSPGISMLNYIVEHPEMNFPEEWEEKRLFFLGTVGKQTWNDTFEYTIPYLYWDKKKLCWEKHVKNFYSPSGMYHTFNGDDYSCGPERNYTDHALVLND